jgi:HTH-type transcriptional regulator/antitoxin HigA
MKPKVIKNDKEYKAALSKVESLMDAAANSIEEADLELWSLLVENYERESFPIDTPDPVEAIRFRMEQQGLRPVDLTQFIKSKSRVSEVLSHKRTLTLAMIRALSAGLHIPVEVLVREPQSVRVAKPKRRHKVRAA